MQMRMGRRAGKRGQAVRRRKGAEALAGATSRPSNAQARLWSSSIFATNGSSKRSRSAWS
jgi:hypothetical protein